MPKALSDREREICTLIADGATNRDIAETLVLSENTVKTHILRIMAKLDAKNRAHAAVLYDRHRREP